MSDIYKSFGRKVKKYRKAKKYSIQELSSKLQVSVGLICNIETGKNDVFKLELLNKLINTLEIPISDIIKNNQETEDEVCVASNDKIVTLSLKSNLNNFDNIKELLIEINSTLLEFVTEFEDETSAALTLKEFIIQQINTIKNIKYID